MPHLTHRFIYFDIDRGSPANTRRHTDEQLDNSWAEQVEVLYQQKYGETLQQSGQKLTELMGQILPQIGTIDTVYNGPLRLRADNGERIDAFPENSNVQYLGQIKRTVDNIGQTIDTDQQAGTTNTHLWFQVRVQSPNGRTATGWMSGEYIFGGIGLNNSENTETQTTPPPPIETTTSAQEQVPNLDQISFIDIPGADTLFRVHPNAGNSDWLKDLSELIKGFLNFKNVNGAYQLQLDSGSSQDPYQPQTVVPSAILGALQPDTWSSLNPAQQEQLLQNTFGSINIAVLSQFLQNNLNNLNPNQTRVLLETIQRSTPLLDVQNISHVQSFVLHAAQLKLSPSRTLTQLFSPDQTGQKPINQPGNQLTLDLLRNSLLESSLTAQSPEAFRVKLEQALSTADSYQAFLTQMELTDQELQDLIIPSFYEYYVNMVRIIDHVDQRG